MIIDDITADPPTIQPHEMARGWIVGADGPTFIIQFLDGRPPIVGPDAITFFTNNTTQEVNTMPLSEANYDDEASHDADPVIDRYTRDLVVVQYIGENVTSAVALKQVRQPWCDLRRDCTVAYVSLDLTPSVPGKAMNAAPGVEQIVWLGLPEWHPCFEAGEREIAVLRYLPRTSYLMDVIEGGRVEQVELASAFDTSGYVSIIGWCGSLEQAEDQATELRQAVRAHARAGLPRDEFEDVADPAAGRFGTRAAWGLSR